MQGGWYVTGTNFILPMIPFVQVFTLITSWVRLPPKHVSKVSLQCDREGFYGDRVVTVASLDSALYNDYFCLVTMNKQ